MVVVFVLEAMGFKFLPLWSVLCWMGIRGLCKLSDGRLWRKLGLALVGRAMFFNPSFCRDCAPSLQFGLRRPSPGVYSLCGRASASVVVLMVTSCMRVYANVPCPSGLLLPVPLTMWQATVAMPLLETPGCSLEILAQSLVGSLLLSPGSLCVQSFVVPSKSLFPQSCGSSVIKSHWLSQSNSLGVLSPFAGSPGWEICYEP